MQTNTVLQCIAIKMVSHQWFVALHNLYCIALHHSITTKSGTISVIHCTALARALGSIYWPQWPHRNLAGMMMICDLILNMVDMMMTHVLCKGVVYIDPHWQWPVSVFALWNMDQEYIELSDSPWNGDLMLTIWMVTMMMMTMMTITWPGDGVSLVYYWPSLAVDFPLLTLQSPFWSRNSSSLGEIFNCYIYIYCHYTQHIILRHKNQITTVSNCHLIASKYHNCEWPIQAKVGVI